MTLAQRLHDEYMSIRSDCALLTAADAKHTPYLFNTLSSIHENFPSHPQIHVFDIGMTSAQRRELLNTSWLKLHEVVHYVPHWKANWSWKPYILTQATERYRIYFDSANFVVYRPLELWFLAVKRYGVFLISNSQKLQDITPSDYWRAFGLAKWDYGNTPTFGAGLFGFTKDSPAHDAVCESLEYSSKGWTLGRSADERSPNYVGNVRDCTCFRADQTLLNLAMRKQYGNELHIRDARRYCGLGGPTDHPRQFVWYARRDHASLLYFWHALQSRSSAYWYNRITAISKIEFLHWARKARAIWRRSRQA